MGTINRINNNWWHFSFFFFCRSSVANFSHVLHRIKFLQLWCSWSMGAARERRRRKMDRGKMTMVLFLHRRCDYNFFVFSSFQFLSEIIIFCEDRLFVPLNFVLPMFYSFHEKLTTFPNNNIFTGFNVQNPYSKSSRLHVRPAFIPPHATILREFETRMNRHTQG